MSIYFYENWLQHDDAKNHFSSHGWFFYDFSLLYFFHQCQYIFSLRYLFEWLAANIFLFCVFQFLFHKNCMKHTYEEIVILLKNLLLTKFTLNNSLLMVRFIQEVRDVIRIWRKCLVKNKNTLSSFIESLWRTHFVNKSDYKNTYKILQPQNFWIHFSHNILVKTFFHILSNSHSFWLLNCG